MENLYIIWSDRNQTGIPIIDEQHRGIVSTINSLHYFVQKGRGEDVIAPTLIMLKQYTNIHFSTEEDLVSKSEFPNKESHFSLHETFKNEIDYIYKDKNIFDKSDVILKFLKDWWLNHINVEDKKYVSFLG
ncbi:MAG TPA: hemerythrin family protein [Thermodesulfobacteriota bacterium]|nr:hemerythrin family protein [Thermodesulfobacteriota bacterium]